MKNLIGQFFHGKSKGVSVRGILDFKLYIFLYLKHVIITE
jgi:hypothetical protein